jgi:hypothetical protein
MHRERERERELDSEAYYSCGDCLMDDKLRSGVGLAAALGALVAVIVGANSVLGDRPTGEPDAGSVATPAKVECEPPPYLADEICLNPEYITFETPLTNHPTITINGKTITLPDNTILGGPGRPFGGPVGNVVTIKIGESWVSYTLDGYLFDSHVEPADSEALKPVLDALKTAPAEGETP